ncbi:MAG TPA: universal stress protein [Gemmatimonadales bacterium]|nr:universal stress protein [Gemmatimonadales bacterium]
MSAARGGFRSIVVPLDGSRYAEQALPAASAVARAARARIRLVLVHRLPPPPEDPYTAKLYVSVELAVRKSEREYLRKIARRLKASGLQAAALLLQGPAGPTLVEWIRGSDADLVVMTTHGRGALGRAAYGSVADQLVRSLEVPILLLRPEDTDRAVDDAPWMAREIVVGLDGSRTAEAALEPATALARILQVPMSLVQVIPPLAVATGPPLSFPTGYDERITEVRRHEALDYVEDVAGALREQGVTATAAVVLGDSPAGTLRDLGRPERGALLAVGTRGRGGVKRLMLGSVADKLVRGARVPVLVVPPRRRGR